MRNRFGLCAAAGLLLSCGTADQPETANTMDSAAISQKAIEEAAAIIDSTLGQMRRAEAATFPCSIFSVDDVVQLTGTPADSGAYAFVHRNEDDKEWRSASCAWSGSNEQATDVDLWVSLPENFDNRQVICHPAIGAREVPGIGKAAWWSFMDGFGIGTLRVCTDKALLEVKIDRRDGKEAEVQDVARAVAQKVIERLPS
jgi:hypothetical protein